MGGDQRTELADDVRVTAERDIRRYPVLDSACPQLLQARDLRLREVLVADLGQRLTAPQRERLAEVRRRPARFVGRERATAVAGEALETAHVDVLRRGPQEVGTRPGEQHLAPGGRLQRLPEPGDVYLQGVLRARGGVLPPQPVDEDITGHRLVRAEEENREQRALLLAADIEDVAVHAGLDRPKQPVIDPCCGPQLHPPRTVLPTVAARTGYRKPQVSASASRCELFVRSRRKDRATASRGLGGLGCGARGSEATIRDHR